MVQRAVSVPIMLRDQVIVIRKPIMNGGVTIVVVVVTALKYSNMFPIITAI
jgi:hypothetical protein